MNNSYILTNLGWQPFFQQQLTLDEWDTTYPTRIIEFHRSELLVAGEAGEYSLKLLASMPALVVGDWVLLDNDQSFVRLLDRKSCFSRKAAGTKLKKQLISANVDTALIVSSLNEDFNLNRIERFLSLVNEAGAEPVVLLSKSDLCSVADEFVHQIQSMDSRLMVETLNCLDAESVSKLSAWLKPGSTVAVIGSSGVGKSTLVNTLLGEQAQSTGGIREDDSKGRHTTSSRSLIKLGSGALIMDTPGMREIQLADAKEGIASTFKDIETIAEHCRFGDCSHAREPGCAVQAAIEAGDLNSRRVNNYQKLLREEAHNSASLSEKRAKDKALGKFYKTTQSEASRLKGR